MDSKCLVHEVQVSCAEDTVGQRKAHSVGMKPRPYSTIQVLAAHCMPAVSPHTCTKCHLEHRRGDGVARQQLDG